MNRPPILATMVGKRILVEWVGVLPPPAEEEEDEFEGNWPDNVTLLSRQIGKISAFNFDGYNELGIEVRSGEDDHPQFISWNAVLSIERLPDQN